MKVVFASDIHGSLTATQSYLVAAEREAADLIVLLGDLYYHGPRNPLPEGYQPMAVSEALNAVADKLLVIRGNCDAEVDEMISRFPFLIGAQLEVNGKLLYLTHGHRYCPTAMPREKCDYLFYGHTHLYGFTGVEKTLAVNVGSVGLPKGGNPPTYAVMDETRIIIKTLEGLAVEERTI